MRELQRSALLAKLVFPQKVQISNSNLLQHRIEGYPFFWLEGLMVYSSAPLQVYFHLPVKATK